MLHELAQGLMNVAISLAGSSAPRKGAPVLSHEWLKIVVQQDGVQLARLSLKGAFLTER